MTNTTKLNEKQLAQIEAIVLFNKGRTVLSQAELKLSNQKLAGLAYGPQFVIKNKKAKAGVWGQYDLGKLLPEAVVKKLKRVAADNKARRQMIRELMAQARPHVA